MVYLPKTISDMNEAKTLGNPDVILLNSFLRLFLGRFFYVKMFINPSLFKVFYLFL